MLLPAVDVMSSRELFGARVRKEEEEEMRSQGGHISQVKGEFEPSVFFFLPNLSFVTLGVQKCDLFGPLAIATIITTLQDQFSRQKVKLLQLNFHDLLN